MGDICSLVITVFVLVTRQAYATKAEMYTTQNFGAIRTTSYPHFVMFYASWCEHCKLLQPLWDQYAEESRIKRQIKVAKVDCTANTLLCASEGIKAYPTLRLFSNQQKYTYRGKRNLEEFSRFVQDNAQNLEDGKVPIEAPSLETTAFEDNFNVKATVLDADNFEEILANGYVFVDFYAPWCPHCIDLEPVWDKLAARFKHDIIIAKVDCTAEPDICREHSISGYPSLILFLNGQRVDQFNHVRTFDALVSFVERSTTNTVIPFEDESTLTIDEPETHDDHLHHAKLTEFTETSLLIALKVRPHLILFYVDGLDVATSNSVILLQEYTTNLQSDDASNPFAGAVDCRIFQRLCLNKLKLNHYPSIYYMRSVEDYVAYKGLLDHASLVAFVHSIKFLKKEL